ncbi:MAG: thiol peroxidase [Culicoidibacterales bacterium]
MGFTFKGGPITLEGTQLKVGDKLPDAVVVTMELEEKGILALAGAVKVISLAPSLDTGVCDLQTKGFLAKLAGIAGVNLITVSADLPFAQARWCGAAETKDAVVVSDYRFREVGQKFGAMIKELQLLTRAVIVADSNNIVTYVEYVEEVTNQVDFDAAVAAVAKIKA